MLSFPVCQIGMAIQFLSNCFSPWFVAHSMNHMVIIFGTILLLYLNEHPHCARVLSVYNHAGGVLEMEI